MKHKFTKDLGNVVEVLELGFEEKWIYVHYTKGSIERTACLLKTANKTDKEYLESFFTENKISEEMICEVQKYLNGTDYTKVNYWNEYITFLLKTLSFNMVFGVTIALCVYGGYTLGTFFDDRYHLFPLFTLLSTFIGIAIGGLTVYSMIFKFFKTPGSRNKKQDQELASEENILQSPVIEVTIDQVRNAIRQFSESLPKGVYRTILVKDDNSIDFGQLISILGGLPTKKYYMSKETYDLFEEEEKHIALEMDLVQKAVDQYVKDHKEYPMLKYDHDRRVNYFQLLQEHYLDKAPETQFYITNLDGLVTHIKPKKRSTSL